MSEVSTENRSFVFTGWHMAAIMGLFFGTIIVVNFGMAFMASKSWTGLVVKNSYVASQKFNVDLAAAKRQTAAGWHSQMSYKNGSLTVKVLDRDGQHVELKQPVLAIGRPAFEQKDQTLDLALQSDGQAAALVLLDRGEWFVRVSGLVNGEPYRRDARVMVDSAYNGKVQ